MAMSNAERQATYRAKHLKTHQKIELVLDQSVYDHLQDLVQASGQSRQDFMTGLIQSIPLPVKEPVIHDAPQNDTPSDPLHVTDARIQPTKEPKKLWLGVYKCQSSTTSGKPCRIGTNLSIVSFTFRNQVYEAQSCQHHKDSFAIHKKYF